MYHLVSFSLLLSSCFYIYWYSVPGHTRSVDTLLSFANAYCGLDKQPFNQEEVIATYKALIRGMPRANQYLLLYVLDLLSVFARKSDKNLMTATSKSLS